MGKYFTLSEMTRSRKAKALGIDNNPPQDVMPALARTISRMDRVREILGYPVTVTSGYRCEKLNRSIGGAEDSQHTTGEAVDFTCPAFGDAKAIVKALYPHMEGLGVDQMILEPGWVHISFTANPRLQTLREEGGRYFAFKPIGAFGGEV